MKFLKDLKVDINALEAGGSALAGMLFESYLNAPSDGNEDQDPVSDERALYAMAGAGLYLFAKGIYQGCRYLGGHTAQTPAEPRDREGSDQGDHNASGPSTRRRTTIPQ